MTGTSVLNQKCALLRSGAISFGCLACYFAMIRFSLICTVSTGSSTSGFSISFRAVFLLSLPCLHINFPVFGEGNDISVHFAARHEVVE